MVLTEDEVILERCEKFLSPLYWTDINIRSQTYSQTYSINDISYVQFSPEKPHYSVNYIIENWSSLMPRLCKIGDTFGPSWSTVWFQLHVCTTDIKFNGSSVAIRWDSNSEAMLYDENGRHIQAFTGGNGSDRRDLCIITEKIDQNTDDVIFYIEMACNGMFGNGSNGMIRPPDEHRTFTLACADIVILNTPAITLFWDLTILHELATSSPDKGLVADVITCINGILNTIKLKEITSINECHNRASGLLSSPTNYHINHNICAIGHCHIDTAWLWPYKETRRKVARSWATQLKLMDEYSDWRFVASQTVHWEWLQNDQPDLFQRVLARVKDGRFIPIGGSYVEFDANIPSAESMIRQFLYGTEYLHEALGITSDVFWLPDTFGYSAQLPQIMNGFGIKYFLSQKLSWNLFNVFPYSTFIWEGLDKSTVIAHFPPADTYNSSASAHDVFKSCSNHKSLKTSNRSLLLFGHGDGGGGPAVSHLEHLFRLERSKGTPTIEISTSPSDFFYQIEADHERNISVLCIPRWSGELYLELHQGTLTTQATIKKQNRQCESIMRTFEGLTVFASVCASLNEEDTIYLRVQTTLLWKKLLLNQFHDVLPGSSIAQVYRDSDAMLSEVLTQAQAHIDMLIEKLAPIKTEQYTVLVNMTNFQRVEITETGVFSVEPFGFCFLDSPSMLPSPLSRAEATKQPDGNYLIENSRISAILSSSGALLSLIDKECNREVISQAFSGNNLVLYDDVPFYWDAWDIFEYYKYTGQSLNSKGTQEGNTKPAKDSFRYESIISSTAPEASITFRISAWSDTSTYIEQIIALKPLSSTLEFRTTVSWAEAHKLLKVEFPLSIVSRVASYEMQSGFVERPTHRNNPYDAAQFEVCGHRYADLSEGDYGVSLLNDGKYGYNCRGSTLCLSLLRSPKSPDPDCDMGVSTFRYGIYVHTGGTIHQGRVTQAATLFNSVLSSHTISANKSNDALATDNSAALLSGLLRISSPENCGLVIDAIKISEDGLGYVIRFTEVMCTRGRAVVDSTSMSLRTAHIVDMRERENSSDESKDETDNILNILSETSFSLKYEPFKIYTVYVCKYGNTYLSGPHQELAV